MERLVQNGPNKGNLAVTETSPGYYKDSAGVWVKHDIIEGYPRIAAEADDVIFEDDKFTPTNFLGKIAIGMFEILSGGALMEYQPDGDHAIANEIRSRVESDSTTDDISPAARERMINEAVNDFTYEHARLTGERIEQEIASAA